jgi:hypothetical protein
MAALAGCGDRAGAPQRVTVYEVKGTVLLADGKPLKGGHIYFVPQDGALTSEGKIGPDGIFSLVTGNSGDGAPSGDFKVRIEPEDPSLLPGPTPSARTRRLPFPQKYLDEDSSGLKVTVKAEANRLEPFRLK